MNSTSRTRRPSTLPLGCYSSGTLRPEDLIPSLLWELDRIHLSKADRAQVREIAREATLDPSDSSGDLWADLCDIASSYCPPFAHFGSTEGDGACIGVWADVESAQQACQEGEIYGEADRPITTKGTRWVDNAVCGYALFHGDQPLMHTWRDRVPNGALFLVISDHGNCSLLQSRGRYRQAREVWGVV